MERYLQSLVVLVHVLSFYLLPVVGVCCSIKPCSVVLWIIALGGLSSHILVGLPALLWVSVDLSSVGFHSAAFLVHLSLLCVTIRRACRHFIFFCASYQFVMPCISIISSASFVLLFTSSIQSSRLSSWLALLPSSSPNEMLLSWSHSSCVLIYS